MSDTRTVELNTEANTTTCPVGVLGLLASLVIWATVGLGVCSVVGI